MRLQGGAQERPRTLRARKSPKMRGEPSSFMGSSVSDGLGLREHKSIFLYA
jgi:hypothetical protein